MTNDQTPGIAGMLAAVPVVLAQNGRSDVDVESILGYVLVGLVVGLVARLIVPGRDPFGLLGTLLLGIVGAVIGGWAATNFGLGRMLTWVVAIAAAVVLLFIYEAARKKR